MSTSLHDMKMSKKDKGGVIMTQKKGNEEKNGLDEKSAVLYKQTMLKLGECMDRMVERGFQEKESWLCMKIANSIYLMCLYIQRVNGIEDAEIRERVVSFCGQASQALYEACQHYAEAQDDAVIDGVLEGMKALYSFERTKQLIQAYL